MSEEELAIEAIETALVGQLEGIDTDAIVSGLLDKLNDDYAATLEAQIEKPYNLADPGWEADFDAPQEDFGYHMCPSESDEEAPNEGFCEFVASTESDSSSQEASMSQGDKSKIIEIMSRIQLRAPAWLQRYLLSSIPDRVLIAKFSRALVEP